MEVDTLTFNDIHRHISRVVWTRMVSAKSPWALDESVLDARPHYIPVSHGEGRERPACGAKLARQVLSESRRNL
ncbi:MAG: phosphoribosylformylglycinamidine synthase subunit PurQ [Treponema sp.]|nr:phosphoribosylformylglycinamidine synthase subunit PurQ [Treponema sp.]